MLAYLDDHELKASTLVMIAALWFAIPLASRRDQR